MIGWTPIGELPKSTTPWTMGVWRGEGGRETVIFVNEHHTPWIYADGKFEPLSLKGRKIK